MKVSNFSLEMLRGVTGLLSSKRVLTNRVVWAFIAALVALSIGIAYRVAMFGDIGWGAVGAFSAITVPLGTIATAIYRKKDPEATDVVAK